MKGFTLIELLITISLTILLAAVAVPIYGSLQVSAQLNESSAQLIQALRTAKQRSLARYNGAQHGVKFESNGYTLFQGSAYATRELAYDRAVNLSDVLGLTWNLADSGDEIVFSSGLGQPSATGTITLIHDISGRRTITINDLGVVAEVSY